MDFLDVKSQKNSIMLFSLESKVTGTVILAPEGINATVSGDNYSLDNFLDKLKGIINLDDIDIKFSYSTKNPFKRFKVKIKNEIVSLGVNDIKPHINTGKFVKSDQWNTIINDPSTVIIDTRNSYEISIGSFLNSLSPNKKTFREFPKWVKENLSGKENKKIAMFCTGGIRCEKASSYLKSIGFNDVVQLEGGILRYLEVIDSDKSLWDGECFVFDERVSVIHGLKEGNYKMCHACRMPINEKDIQNKSYVKGVSCIYCYDKTSDSDKKRFFDRQKQVELSKLNKTNHFASQKKI